MSLPDGDPAPPPPGLYVLATPIGNLGDISRRALDILAGCDLVACEDTRTSGKLLKHFGLSKSLVSYHEHNEKEQARHLADKIASGMAVALISDAGTPAVSDPGFRVVRECRRRGLPVSPIPGPNAAIAALSVSGLPTDTFQFVGFLPAKSAARRRFFEEIQTSGVTQVLYESNHRILKFLDEFLEVLGSGRILCVAREMTKLHETIVTGTADKVVEQVRQRSQKGEFVVVIAPAGFEL